MENISSEQELLKLRRDGKITEDEYKQLLEAMRKSPAADPQEQINLARKYVLWVGLAMVVIIAAAIYLTRSDYDAGVVPRLLETNTIVPKVRVGDYTFDMSKDDVLKKLGKPETIFYGEERYTLNNLPRTYYMHFGDVSFRILDDSVKEITAHSPVYKFINGLGVGDSEQKIKQAFGDDFQLKETEWKDFLTYRDQGLVFEIHKNNRTVMEINVYPK